MSHLIIIIITLFPEDNIFGTDASLAFRYSFGIVSVCVTDAVDVHIFVLFMLFLMRKLICAFVVRIWH